MKEVPRSIQRPDYADDPRGIPRSEISSKKSGQIEVLSPQDIEGNVSRYCMVNIDRAYIFTDLTIAFKKAQKILLP